MWDDFYREPSEFDEKVDEFKESLRASVKEEINSEMNNLRKENAALREIRDNWQAKVRELEEGYNAKKRELNTAIREAEDAMRRAKQLCFKELVSQVAPVVWTMQYETITLPKCNLCDKYRYREYTTPLGRIAKEECECKATKRRAYVKRAPIIELYVHDGRKLRPYYLTCNDDDATSRWSNDFFDDTPFEDIPKWGRPLFHDENRARRYAAWLNKMEGSP